MTVANHLTPVGPLNQDRIEVCRKQGFLVVRNLLDEQSTREVTKWADEIASWPEIAGKYMMYFEQAASGVGDRLLNRAEDLTSFHPGLHKLMERQEVMGAVAQIFGEPAVLFKDKINFKMPGGGGFDAHQDVQAGWNTYADIHITAMLSIDAGTVENGCLEFAPGFNREGLIGQAWTPLTDAALSENSYQRILTNPGDAVFFDSYAPHRSAGNMTDKPRRVAYFTFNKASQGDHRGQYYADKRASYPPDIERLPGKDYRFRV